jgi:voltage-gated potassium channel Kch
MQLTGAGFILTAVDVFAVPWLQEAVSPSAPMAAPAPTDRVVICEHTPRTDAFITELDARDRDYILVVPDETAAIELDEAGYDVVHGDPESTDVLSSARVETAVVVDTDDDTGASVVLSTRELHPEIPVVTPVEEAGLARYHRAAGADEVLSPGQLLSRRLAE